jgi:hypothetical protein
MAFEAKRANGLSDVDVVINLVRTHTYEDIITYESFSEVLNAGLERDVTRKDIHRIVNLAIPKIRMAHQMSLEAVANVGYKILHPNEQVTRQADKKRIKTHRQSRALVSIARDANQSLLSSEASRVREHHLTYAATLEVNLRQENQVAKRIMAFFRGEG